MELHESPNGGNDDPDATYPSLEDLLDAVDLALYIIDAIDTRVSFGDREAAGLIGSEAMRKAFLDGIAETPLGMALSDEMVSLAAPDLLTENGTDDSSAALF